MKVIQDLVFEYFFADPEPDLESRIWFYGILAVCLFGAFCLGFSS